MSQDVLKDLIEAAKEVLAVHTIRAPLMTISDKMLALQRAIQRIEKAKNEDNSKAL